MIDRINNIQATSESQGKKIYRWLLWLTIILSILVVISLAVSLAYSNVETIDQFVLDLKPWLAYWRLLVFLTVFGGWGLWAKMYARWTSMSENQLEQMMNIRWRMAIWVLVMEAVFSQHVLSDFVNTILSGDIL